MISLQITYFCNTFSFPFDWRTPFGYIGCNIIQISTAYMCEKVYALGVNLTFGFSVFLTNFVTDIEEKLRQFNVKLNKWKMKNCLNMRQRGELKNDLIDIIQFYSDTRELSIIFIHLSI